MQPVPLSVRGILILWLILLALCASWSVSCSQTQAGPSSGSDASAQHRLASGPVRFPSCVFADTQACPLSWVGCSAQRVPGDAFTPSLVVVVDTV